MVIINDFNGLTAVITGASSGMGCSVALCDVQEKSLLETAQECEVAKKGTSVKVVSQVCDVTNDDQIREFKTKVEESFNGKVNILINNAGISTGGSFLDMSYERYDKVFDVSYKGVLLFTRAFLPLIVKQEIGYVVNVSSINAFWCCLGPAKWPLGSPPHTPYSAAKSAVKGFTEALLVDSYQNFPHIGVASVHPGHVGTNIGKNQDYKDMSQKELNIYKTVLSYDPRIGSQAFEMTAEDIQDHLGTQFQKNGLSASDAAAEIINGMKTGSTRILVGEDARVVDVLARLFPRAIYNDLFITTILGPAMILATKVGRPFGLPLGRFAFPALVSAGGFGLWNFVNGMRAKL